VLLFVGRIQPLKGLDVAVAALAAMADRTVTLLVVGGPSGAEGDAELAKVTAMVRELGLEARVRMVPPQPHHLLSTYYRAADICVVPSRSESFGLVAAEAAACGIPVVATEVGGLTTLVDHGVTGLLMPTRRPADWAAALDGLLADSSLRQSMAAAAAIHGRQYTWSTAAARLRRLYSDLSNANIGAACAAAA